MKLIYKDYCGSYSITKCADGSAVLRCRNSANGHLDLNKRYSTINGAKRALSRYCGGMPKLIKGGII